MPVFLIRHAHAGSRSQWAGDDLDRPLTPKGWSQADGLVLRLEDEPIKRVLSSPTQRCIETVEPLARRLGLEVESDRAFFEGADPDQAIERLLAQAKRNVAVCSHGDVIPKVIRRLAAHGMRTKDANISQKGSVWVLEVDDGAFTRAKYYPPS